MDEEYKFLDFFFLFFCKMQNRVWSKVLELTQSQLEWNIEKKNLVVFCPDLSTHTVKKNLHSIQFTVKKLQHSYTNICQTNYELKLSKK